MYLVFFHHCVYCASCSYGCWFQIQICVGGSARCRIWDPRESPVRRTTEWDLQTGNWKDDLQLSSCPNSQCRANTVPMRLWLPLCPASVSLCARICFTLILPLSLSEQQVEEIAQFEHSRRRGLLELNLPCLLSYMLLEYLNSRRSSSECLLTSTANHIQWKFSPPEKTMARNMFCMHVNTVNFYL